MKMNWHKVTITCPKCGSNDPVPFAVHGCADGEILIEWICSCGVKLDWKSNFALMITSAYQADLREHHEEKKAEFQQRQQERKQDSPAIAPPVFTDDDLKELHKQHILDDNEQAA